MDHRRSPAGSRIGGFRTPAPCPDARPVMAASENIHHAGHSSAAFDHPKAGVSSAITLRRGRAPRAPPQCGVSMPGNRRSRVDDEAEHGQRFNGARIGFDDSRSAEPVRQRPRDVASQTLRSFAQDQTAQRTQNPFTANLIAGYREAPVLLSYRPSRTPR